MLHNILSVVAALIIVGAGMHAIYKNGGDIFALLGCLVQLFFYGFLFVIMWVFLWGMFVH